MPVNRSVGDVMARPVLGQLIRVEWIDIHTDHSWTAPDAVLGVAECLTVGYAVAIDDVSITLAACTGRAKNAATEQEVNLRMCIPWGCITGWSPLRCGKAVKP